jgi:hypothetical protein
VLSKRVVNRIVAAARPERMQAPLVRDQPAPAGDVNGPAAGRSPFSGHSVALAPDLGEFVLSGSTKSPRSRTGTAKCPPQGFCQVEMAHDVNRGSTFWSAARHPGGHSGPWTVRPPAGTAGSRTEGGAGGHVARQCAKWGAREQSERGARPEPDAKRPRDTSRRQHNDRVTPAEPDSKTTARHQPKAAQRPRDTSPAANDRATRGERGRAESPRRRPGPGDLCGDSGRPGRAAHDTIGAGASA